MLFTANMSVEPLVFCCLRFAAFRSRLPLWAAVASGFSRPARGYFDRVASNRPGHPVATRYWRQLDVRKQTKQQGFIEIAHGAFVKINHSPRFERPDIVYLHD